MVRPYPADVAPEGTHVFQFQFGAPDEADEAIDEVARFFKRHVRYYRTARG
jgi:hypothetical protein